MEMTSLPAIDEMHQLDEDGLNVWTILLEAEQLALQEAHVEAKYRDPLISVRLLGFLMKDLWVYANGWNLGNEPYTSIKHKIESCCRADDWYGLLVDLGVKYRNHLLQVFRFNERRRSTPSPDDSRREPRLSFIPAQQRLIADMKNSECSTRKQALLRDGFKCAITGFYDVRACKLTGEAASNAPRYSDTKAGYILPDAIQNGGETSLPPLLEIFGAQDLAQSLYSNTVNKQQNVITLESRLHTRFDNLELWLEPVSGQEHTYDVCKTDDVSLTMLGMPIPPRITLRVDPSAAVSAEKEGLTLTLPDPLLMAIRAVCVRVCNLSGATEQMGFIIDELEDTTVLSGDGDMAALLASRLSMYVT